MAATIVSSAIGSLAPLIQYAVGPLLSVRKDLESIRDELESMRSFLEDAEARQDREEGVKTWVSQVRELAYDVEDCLENFAMLLDERRNQRHGICAFPQRTFVYLKTVKQRCKFAHELQDLKVRALAVARRSKDYNFNMAMGGNQPSSSNLSNNRDDLLRTDVFAWDSDLVGIEESKKQLIDWLMEDSEQLIGISVVGMGGLGKTTLVRKAYESISQQFKYHDWVTVSQSFDMKVFLKQVLIKFAPDSGEKEKITKEDCVQRLVEMFKERLENDKYLIIFDDLWSTRDWELIKKALPENNLCGSRVMVTTRIHDVAQECANSDRHVYEVKPLEKEPARRLFRKKARIADQLDRSSQREMEDLILKKCGGLPLAIVVIAGLLAHKPVDMAAWRNLLHSLNTGQDEDRSVQRMENIINLSYNRLPCHHLKTCYLYLSIFPEDYEIKRSLILGLWSAEGFLEEKQGLTPEEVGDGYLRELAIRNMIQQTKLDSLGTGRIKSFRLHDLIAEMLVKKAKNENLVTFLHDLAEVQHEPSARREVQTNIRRISIVRRVENSSSVEHMDFSHCRSVINFLEGYSDPFRPSSTATAKRKPYLPPSMRQVRVLDLRGFAVLFSVPDEILKLRHLRHLGLSCQIPAWYIKKGALRRLTSLRGLILDGQVEQLVKLTQLRYLNVLYVGTDIHLCRSIEKMVNLISLKLVLMPWADNGENLLYISSPPPHLEKLVLSGRLSQGVIPKWISSHQNIRELVLRMSHLTEDPFQALHALPNLVKLRLYGSSYVGSCLCCQDKRGFLTLKRLYLTELTELTEIRIEEGAMHCLEFLHISNCDKLERVPVGIEQLKNIKALELELLPEELYDSIAKEPRGMDCWRVAHIPSINVYGGTRRRDFP